MSLIAKQPRLSAAALPPDSWHPAPGGGPAPPSRTADTLRAFQGLVAHDQCNCQGVAHTFMIQDLQLEDTVFDPHIHVDELAS